MIASAGRFWYCHSLVKTNPSPPTSPKNEIMAQPTGKNLLTTHCCREQLHTLRHSSAGIQYKTQEQNEIKSRMCVYRIKHHRYTYKEVKVKVTFYFIGPVFYSKFTEKYSKFKVSWFLAFNYLDILLGQGVICYSY